MVLCWPKMPYCNITKKYCSWTMELWYEKYFVMLSHHLIQAPSALNGKLFQLILLNIERDAVTWKHRFSTQTLMKYGLLRKYFIRISSIEHSAMMIRYLGWHCAVGRVIPFLQLQLDLSGTFDLCWKELECVSVKV